MEARPAVLILGLSPPAHPPERAIIQHLSDVVYNPVQGGSRAVQCGEEWYVAVRDVDADVDAATRGGIRVGRVRDYGWEEVSDRAVAMSWPACVIRTAWTGGRGPGGPGARVICSASRASRGARSG